MPEYASPRDNIELLALRGAQARAGGRPLSLASFMGSTASGPRMGKVNTGLTDEEREAQSELAKAMELHKRQWGSSPIGIHAAQRAQSLAGVMSYSLGKDAPSADVVAAPNVGPSAHPFVKRASETRPEYKLGESKEGKVRECEPAESKLGESKLAEKLGESKPAVKLGESKPAVKLGESKPAEKLGESKPAEKLGESKPAEHKLSQLSLGEKAALREKPIVDPSTKPKISRAHAGKAKAPPPPLPPSAKSPRILVKQAR